MSLEQLDPVTYYAQEVTAGRIVAGPHVRNTCKRHLRDIQDGAKRGLYFDYEAMYRVFRFFEKYLKLSEGQYEGRDFQLHISQKFIIGSLYGWKKANGYRRFTRAYIEQGKGNGKALSVDTPIPTPDGFKTMGELQVGDFVFDDNGMPTQILKTSEIMFDRDCYELTFSDGEKVIADAGHLWKVNGEILTTYQVSKLMHRINYVDAQRFIISCIPVDPVPVKCISVAAASQMFLCGVTLIPTHNSPLAGGIGLFGMLSDKEPGAQIYSAGADRNQSDILFQDAVKMAKSSPRINEMMTYSGNQKVFNMACLRRKQGNSFFKPLAKTAGKSGSGPRPHYALIDELHEHPDRAVMDLLESGFKWRRQPLLFIITNSGSDRNSICFEEHEHAIKVAEGVIEDDSTFSYVCALDNGDNPLEDPECWIKANPLLGVTITHEYLAKKVKQAIMMPGKANGIKRLHFCIWTDSVEAWVTRETWMSLEDPEMRIEQFIGKRCHAGLDLSARKDLTAKVLVFEDGWTKERIADDGKVIPPRPKYALFAKGYTPKDTLQDRIKLDKAPYDVWVDQGFIVATPGNYVDLKYVIKDLEDDKIFFNLEKVTYDRFLITRFEEDMVDMGVELPLQEHPQGWNRRQGSPLSMPKSIETLEELILDGRLRVHVNPALRSAVAGATFEVSPALLKRFVKQKATQRIDLIVGAAMGIGSIDAATDDGKSSFDDESYEHFKDSEQLEQLLSDDRPARTEPKSSFDDDNYEPHGVN